MDILDFSLRIGASVLFTVVAIVLVKDQKNRILGATGAAYLYSVVAYLWCSYEGPLLNRDMWLLVLVPGCFVVPPFFWLFSLALFEDRFRINWRHAGVVAGFLALGITAIYTGGIEPAPEAEGVEISQMIFLLRSILSILLVALTLAIVGRGAKEDMVDSRRRLRRIYMTTVGLYMALIVSMELFFQNRDTPPILHVLNSGSIFTFATVIAFLSIALKPGAFFTIVEQNRTPQPRKPEPDDPATEQLLVRINAFFGPDKGYRTEGLTISALADKLQTPEYKVRQAINQHLGYRNFNMMLNEYRVKEACQILGDQDQARLPVLTIALDLGYRSIGPFNRAFKDITGQTPTDYKRQKLA